MGIVRMNIHVNRCTTPLDRCWGTNNLFTRNSAIVIPKWSVHSFCSPTSPTKTSTAASSRRLFMVLWNNEQRLTSQLESSCVCSSLLLFRYILATNEIRHRSIPTWNQLFFSHWYWLGMFSGEMGRWSPHRAAGSQHCNGGFLGPCRWHGCRRVNSFCRLC